jgi:Ca2+-binding EF-hand superfamily protein|nr:EF-hand domain-containing protein [uncultured Psychroserpens sp.]
MASKKKILKKIQIVITNHFSSPEEAFAFFDKGSDGKLSKGEIVKLLKQAEISGFIRGLVASKLIEGYDNDGDGLVDWKEFKVAIGEILGKSKT